MNSLSTIAGVLLGLVFLTSGAAKLARRSEWVRLADEFGAPRGVAAALPWVELGLGALLVVRIAPTAAAVAGFVLLGAFTAAIAVRLHRGQHPLCVCFGAWSAKPLSPWHVVRNVALMLLAVLAMF